MQGKGAERISIVGSRAPLFWGACAAITAGVLLHLPMLAMAHHMGNRLAGMPMEPQMWTGMALIVLGVPAAIYAALPPRWAEHGPNAGTGYEAPDSTPLNRWHAGVLLVLTVGLVIDVMKPATLGFVLPGMSAEYGISKATVAWFPFTALVGTTIGSFVWGWLADVYGRRGLDPAVDHPVRLDLDLRRDAALRAEPPDVLPDGLLGRRHAARSSTPSSPRSCRRGTEPGCSCWSAAPVLVGGYLAASAAAHAFEPVFGWRVLWLQGFPTGILLLALARLIPESPRFLAEQGRDAELVQMRRKFGIVPRPREPAPPDARVAARRQGRLTMALVITAIVWSFVNFGLLLWLPMDLQARGYSSALASGILASSALIALPTIMVAAWTYSRISSKWTLVINILLTLAGLVGALLPAPILSWPPLLVVVIAMLIVGSNGTIAVLLPYAAENYPLGIRGRATGLVAGASKFGGVAVQGLALLGFIPTLGGAALVLLAPMGISAALVAWAGRETRGRSLRELEASA
jgi:putative MFS transporter